MTTMNFHNGFPLDEESFFLWINLPEGKKFQSMSWEEWKKIRPTFACEYCDLSKEKCEC